jgi:hypothetical protein
MAHPELWIGAGFCLFAFSVSFFRPQWIAPVSRFRIAIFTNQRVEDIQFSDKWYRNQRIFGLMILLIGLSFIYAAISFSPG